mgnify:CR=1 FL=1
MSIELMKKVGLGLVALLVVFNTYSVHSMKQHTKKSRAALSGLRARMGDASQRQRPVAGPRNGKPQRGSKGSGEGKGHWKGSKEKKLDESDVK